VDLGPWLAGSAETSPREAVIGQRKRYRGQPDRFFLRSWPRKWIGGKGRGREFRLDEDPGEQDGRVGSGLPEALRSAVEAGEATPGESRLLDEEARRALEALGYLD
jgi:hypothetical protein